MAYDELHWHGVDLAIRAVARERAKIVRWLTALEDNPKAYKRPTIMRTRWGAMLADLNTGLRILRGAKKANEATRKPRKNR